MYTYRLEILICASTKHVTTATVYGSLVILLFLQPYNYCYAGSSAILYIISDVIPPLSLSLSLSLPPSLSLPLFPSLSLTPTLSLSPSLSYSPPFSSSLPLSSLSLSLSLLHSCTQAQYYSLLLFVLACKIIGCMYWFIERVTASRMRLAVN